MSGITGFVGDGTGEDLEAMIGTLTHRGRDGAGRYVDTERPVFLGHTLFDVPGAGHAGPLFSEDGNLALLFDGALYNAAGLREELLRLELPVHQRKSDAELLLYGYEVWGEELARYLEGMFAYAIYDRKRRCIVFGRDRFGQRPLYLYECPGCFAFASELRAFTAHGGLDCALSPTSCQKLLAYGFLPAPHALYEGAAKLPGGCTAVYDIETGTLDVKQYWRYRIEPAPELAAVSEEELAEQLRYLLGRAVQRSLPRGCEPGVLLSGGIDSSGILAMVTSGGFFDTVRTFTVGFHEASEDETNYARMMADLMGSVHHERHVSVDDARERIETVLALLDEPVGGPSVLLAHILYEFAGSKVKVALAGDGGDELLAGYDPFQALAAATLYRRFVPSFVHKGIQRVAEFLPFVGRDERKQYKLKQGLRGMSYGRRLWNPVWLSALEPEAIGELFGEPLPVEELYSEALELWESAASEDIVDRTLEFYGALFLQDGILSKVDRISAMVGLQVRTPFLDSDLVDFIRRLPNCLKLRKKEGKYLLRRALKPHLPSAIITRERKTTWLPLQGWLKDYPNPVPMEPVLSCRTGWVGRRWKEHRQGKANHSPFLWAWLGLQAHVKRLSV